MTCPHNSTYPTNIQNMIERVVILWNSTASVNLLPEKNRRLSLPGETAKSKDAHQGQPEFSVTRCAVLERRVSMNHIIFPLAKP